MPFIDMNLDDVRERTAAPEGTYTLVIEEASLEESKSGKPMIRVILSFEGHTEFDNVWHYLSLPAAEDEPKSSDFKRLMLKRFLHHFNIPSDGGFNTEDFLGARAECFVSQRPVDPDDPNSGVRNEVHIPRLPAEANN